MTSATDGQRAGFNIEAAPLETYSAEDRAFYEWWYGHMVGDMMPPPLADVSYSTARYIWSAATQKAVASMQTADVGATADAEREDFRTLLQQTQCVRDGWHPFTALALQAELLAALDEQQAG